MGCSEYDDILLSIIHALLEQHLSYMNILNVFSSRPPFWRHLCFKSSQIRTYCFVDIVVYMDTMLSTVYDPYKNRCEIQVKISKSMSLLKQIMQDLSLINSVSLYSFQSGMVSLVITLSIENVAIFALIVFSLNPNSS